jgi:rubrerythrin
MSETAQSESVVFFSVLVSSLLESAVGLYTNSLVQMFKGDREIIRWLIEIWTVEESRHGSQMRDYILEKWPEFDWYHTFATFRREYSPLCEVHCLRPTRALELLARCVTETEAALYYRTMASYTEDRRLHSLFSSLYRDEVSHYKFFLEKFRFYNCREKHSWYKLAETIHKRTDLVANEDVAIASKCATLSWRNGAPFDLSEKTVVPKVRQIADKHFPYHAAKKMLIKPLGLNAVQKNIAMASIERTMRAQFAAG